jgi:DNA repair protein RadC
MGCGCTKANPEAVGLRRVSEISYEPLMAVYEEEGSETPSVFGCGPAGCAPHASGHPSAIRVDRVSSRGVPFAESGTEIELPATLQEHYAKAGELRSPSCLPWVRVTRDPATFSKCLAAARALGPITSSKQVFDLFRNEGLTQDQEVFYVLLLDTQAQCRGVGEIARGARDRVQTPIPDILRLPMIEGAMSFVVVHNHPSGRVAPSQADKEVTLAIQKAGEIVGVPLMDHVIIGADSYYSFFDKKIIK